MSVGQVIKRHPRVSIGAAAVAVGIGIFVLVWFQPQKIIFERTVTENAPAATAGSVVRSGTFRSLAHGTTGRTTVIEGADGALVLRLENLDTSNGPDLRVYLSPASADAEGRVLAQDALDLGGLKGNRGSQNYDIPRGTDLATYRSVVIWCRRFTVGFGVAALA